LLVKNTRTRILKKISPKNIPLGSGIRKKLIPDPDPGSGCKKTPDTRSGSATLPRSNLILTNKTYSTNSIPYNIILVN
jgi:hypothetical protein